MHLKLCNAISWKLQLKPSNQIVRQLTFASHKSNAHKLIFSAAHNSLFEAAYPHVLYPQQLNYRLFIALIVYKRVDHTQLFRIFYVSETLISHILYPAVIAGCIFFLGSIVLSYFLSSPHLRQHKNLLNSVVRCLIAMQTLHSTTQQPDRNLCDVNKTNYCNHNGPGLIYMITGACLLIVTSFSM